MLSVQAGLVRFTLPLLVQNVPQAIVVAVADVNLAGATEVANSFGISAVYSNYKDVINHPDVEAVIICSQRIPMPSTSWKPRRPGAHLLRKACGPFASGYSASAGCSCKSRR